MKISERKKLTHQHFYNALTKETHKHVEVILDEGCTDFGICAPQPFRKTIHVMFDYDRQAWVRMEVY